MFLQFASSAVFLLVVVPNFIMFNLLDDSKISESNFLKGIMELYHNDEKDLQY